MAVINENTQKLLEERYFFKNKNTGELLEHSVSDMFSRVAKHACKAELTQELQEEYYKKFYAVMDKQLFMPNTPTLIGAGYDKCLSACSVLPRVPDNLEGIYQHMWNNAKLTKMGAGVGQDLSDIRPTGEIIKSSGGISAGVVNWMHLLNSVAITTIQGDKARRAANMVSLRFNHPDIFNFINSKEQEGHLSSMNISVTITDDEMMRIINDEDLDLIWNKKVYKTVKARDIYNQIIDGMWKNGEPGILWLSTINNDNPFNLQDGKFNENNSHYMVTSNPCGEQILEGYEFCNLGSINLENLMNEKENDLNWNKFREVIQISIRFLDDIIDVNQYVMPEFEAKVLGNRKIGLGVAGFANVLIKLGIKYDSDECLKFIDKLFDFKRKTEQEYNVTLGCEKGNFLNWEESIFGKKNIPARCATISTQAPTGSIASILNTTAYGIEPHFMVCYKRRIVTGEIYEANQLFKDMLHSLIKDEAKEQDIMKECYEKGTTLIKSIPKKLRDLFRCANDISPEWHIKIQAQLQKYYDNAISKTINSPEEATIDELFELLIEAWKLGIKGTTYYRNNSRKGQTIQIGNEKNEESKIRGYVTKAPKKAQGITEQFVSGCGNVYLTITHDDHGNINQTFTNKGSSGTCRSNQEAVSRLISLSLRGGISIEDIVDQLRSVDICSAYVSARKGGKKCSKGSSCPNAMAYLLEQVDKEIKDMIKPTLQEAKCEVEIDNSNLCPECGEKIELVEGCISCKACGWSRC